MCVKSLSPVAEVFKLAASNAIESLVGVLKPRIRAIVTDAVGGDGSGAAGGFSVMGAAKATDRHHVRMNYNLDEDAYQLLEVSEGYISRLYVVSLLLFIFVDSLGRGELSRATCSSTYTHSSHII